MKRRRFFRDVAFAAGGIVSVAARPPALAFARRSPQADRRRPASSVSLSRQFARWVAGLRYDDLPPAVVDRAKGLTLQNLASALLGSQLPAGQQAVRLVTDEEAGVRSGATIMVNGSKATKGGAGFANSEMMLAGGKWDTFRMLTHPGTAIIPSALVAAETEGASGKDFMTGLAAGYEVMERMAADWIPTVMARGFHAGPVFSIFGAAIAAAKIMHFTEDQVQAVISLCTNLAGSNLESRALREGAAVRNAMLAVSLAKQGKIAGGEAVLEGPAGFYHAYAGNNTGELTYSFVGDTHTDLDHMTADLGQRVDVPRDALSHLLDCRLQHRAHRRHREAVRGARHQIPGRRSCGSRRELARDAVSEPRLRHAEGRHDGRAKARKHALLQRVRGRQARLPAAGGHARSARSPGAHEAGDDHPVAPDAALRPRITIFTKDGKSYTKQATGREFIWDFDEEARRIRGVIPGLPVPATQFEQIIATCRDLDRQARADTLVQLTIVK